MRPVDADALARLLDGHPTGGGVAGDETRLLAAFAQAIEASAVRPAAAFKEELRARLLAEAVVVLQRPPLLARLRTWVEEARRRVALRVAAVTSAAALAVAGGGVAAAAEHALPGDALYGVKITLEDVRLLLATDDVARGQRQLAYAGDRVEEARDLAERGEAAGAAVALRAANELARAGTATLIQAHFDGADEALDVVRAFAATQRGRLEALLDELDGSAVVAAHHALAGLQRIEDHVVLVAGCTTCGRAPAPPPQLDVPAPVAPSPLHITVIPPAEQPAGQSGDVCPCPADGAADEAVVVVEPRRPGGPSQPDSAPVDPETPPHEPVPDPPAPPEPDLLPDNVPNPVGGLVDVIEEVVEGVLQQAPPPSAVMDAVEEASDDVDDTLGPRPNLR